MLFRSAFSIECLDKGRDNINVLVSALWCSMPRYSRYRRRIVVMTTLGARTISVVCVLEVVAGIIQ